MAPRLPAPGLEALGTRVAARIRAVRREDALRASALPVLAAGVLGLLAAWRLESRAGLLVVGLGAVALLFLGAWLRAYLGRPGPRAALARLDAAHEGHELFLSAYDLAAVGTPAARLHVDVATGRVEDAAARLPALFPTSLARRVVVAPLTLLLLLAVLLFLDRDGAHEVVREPPTGARPAEAAGETDKPLPKDLATLRARAEKAARRARAQAGQADQPSEAMVAALARHRDTERLARALDEGTSEDAALAARALGERLRNPNLSDAAKERIWKALERALAAANRADLETEMGRRAQAATDALEQLEPHDAAAEMEKLSSHLLTLGETARKRKDTERLSRNLRGARATHSRTVFGDVDEGVASPIARIGVGAALGTADATRPLDATRDEIVSAQPGHAQPGPPEDEKPPMSEAEVAARPMRALPASFERAPEAGLEADGVPSARRALVIRYLRALHKDLESVKK